MLELKVLETQMNNHCKEGNILVALQREVLENLLASSARLTVQGMNSSFNCFNSIMGKFFITVMHSIDPKQCFHCITVISFTKSVFPRLTSIVRYGSFTQYSVYEVAVACCCSMLILCIIFTAKPIFLTMFT